MTVESATYIQDLNASNPAFDDPKSEGDDHLRLIKSTLKASFPNIGGVMWRNQTKSSGPYALQTSDNMTIIQCTAGITVTAVAATLGNGFICVVDNNSGSDCTIAGSTLRPSQAMLLRSDGTNMHGHWMSAQFLDEDNMAANSDIAVASQQSIKAYADLKLPLAGGTMSGTLIMADNTIERPYIDDYAETYTSGSSSTSYNVVMSTAHVHRLTISGTVTISFSGWPTSGRVGSVTLMLVQDGTGSRTVTWPAAVKWANNVAPTLSTGANDIDIFSFFTHDGGTNIYGFECGLNMS